MRDDRDRLLDILRAIDRILVKTTQGRVAFQEDEMLQVWVLHHLQIIGEAARDRSPADKLKHVPRGLQVVDLPCGTDFSLSSSSAGMDFRHGLIEISGPWPGGQSPRSACSSASTKKYSPHITDSLTPRFLWMWYTPPLSIPSQEGSDSARCSWQSVCSM